MRGRTATLCPAVTVSHSPRTHWESPTPISPCQEGACEIWSPALAPALLRASLVGDVVPSVRRIGRVVLAKPAPAHPIPPSCPEALSGSPCSPYKPLLNFSASINSWPSFSISCGTNTTLHLKGFVPLPVPLQARNHPAFSSTHHAPTPSFPPCRTPAPALLQPSQMQAAAFPFPFVLHITSPAPCRSLLLFEAAAQPARHRCWAAIVAGLMEIAALQQAPS